LSLADRANESKKLAVSFGHSGEILTKKTLPHKKEAFFELKVTEQAGQWVSLEQLEQRVQHQRQR